MKICQIFLTYSSQPFTGFPLDLGFLLAFNVGEKKFKACTLFVILKITYFCFVLFPTWDLIAF